MSTRRAATALHRLRHLADAHLGGEVSDMQLLERFRNGNGEAAFTVLVQRHGPMVLGTCRRLLGNGPDAEDAFQATFLALARQASSIRGQGSVGGWLYAVARHVARKTQVAAARRRAHERACPPRIPPSPEPDLRETLRLLEEELDRLPEKYRGPVVLCYLEGKTHEDAARELACPKSSLTSRLARARELLHSRLSRRGVTLSGGGVVGLLLEETAPANIAAGLVPQTVRLAGGAVVPAHLAALAHGVAGGLGGGWLLALVLAAGLAAVGALAAVRADSTPAPAAAPAAQEKPRPRVDLDGDPLPAGAVARFGTRRPLPGVVYGVAVSPDGKLLAATVDNGGVILWDRAAGKEVRRLRGAGETYVGVHFTAGGKEVIAGFGNVLDRWDAATGRHLAGSIDASANLLTVTPDGKTLATAGTDALEIRDPSTLRLRRRIAAAGVHPHFSPLALAPDGKLLAAQVPGTKAGTWEVRFWETATGKLLPASIESASAVVALAFAPDGKVLAVGSRAGTVGLCDVAAGKERHRLTGHRGPVGALAFAPDGKVLATACSAGTLRLWNAADGKELRRCVGHPGGARGLAFAPDGETLLSCGNDRSIRSWETATGAELSPRDGHSSGAYAAAFLPDSRTVVSAGHRGVRLWRALTGERIGLLTALAVDHRAAVALRPDGRVAVVHRGGGEVEFWDVPGRKIVREEHDSQFAAGQKRRVGPWQMVAGPGDILALGGDGFVGVRGPRGRGWTLTEEPGWALSGVALSRDGTRLAKASWKSLGDKGGSRTRVRIWDTATAAPIPTWELDHVSSFVPVALSPDGSLVAVGQGIPGKACVYDTATGKLLSTCRVPAGGIAVLAFSADGRALATGGSEGAVCVWETATGQLRREFVGHPRQVATLAFSPDGRLLVSGSDPTLLVWDLTGRLRDGALPPTRLTAERLAGCWHDLRTAPAARASAAVWELAATPRQAAAFLTEKLRPGRLPAAVQLERLVEELGSPRFEVRRRAEKELEGFADLAAGALRKAAEGGAALEVRRRTAGLLEALAGTGGEPLRTARALEVLEACGTEGVPLLTALARGVPEARLTREARAALARLADREKSPY